MRTPWPDGFPPVFIHVAWDEEVGGDALATHACYSAAKHHADAEAALRVIEDLTQDHVVDRIVDTLTRNPPLVLAPAARPDTIRNALAIGYAQWLGNELGLDVEDRVFQSPGIARTGANGWSRMANRCRFYGPIVAGRNYIIVDDVVTMGGSLADLRGYVETNGGKVICFSALAHRSGNHLPISLDNATSYTLNSRFGNDLETLYRGEFGYGTDCLTEPEARFLLGNCRDARAVSEGIRRARHD